MGSPDVPIGNEQNLKPADGRKHGTSGTFELGPVHLPLPKWAGWSIAALVILYVALQLLSEPIRTIWVRYQMGITAEADMKEAQNHFFEEPLLRATSQGSGGELRAQLYRDGCAAVMWHGAISSSTPKPHFVREITREDQPSPGRIAELERYGPDLTTAGITSIFDVRRYLEASKLAGSQANFPTQPGRPPRAPLLTSKGRQPLLVAQMPGGRCLNPHPGQFQWSYGQQNGCWIQVWRQFPDGCVHYQWFNTCGNYWDVYPDGTPKIFWTKCIH
jgi:hypothetical protein